MTMHCEELASLAPVSGASRVPAISHGAGLAPFGGSGMSIAIADDESLVSAVAGAGAVPVPVWDDGFGPLWVYRDEFGIVGIVRAQTWHDALDCAYDELLKPISDDEIPEAYGFASQDELDSAVALARDGKREYPDVIEGYSYQSNSTGNGIVSPSYNEALDLLTDELAKRLEVEITVESD